jgi:hypothetical protein
VNGALLSLAIVGLLLAGILGFWLVLARAVNGTVASLLAGTMLAGLIGLALLTQTAGSQNYFWQATEPLVAIAIAWCGCILARKYGPRFILVALGIALLGNVALRVTSNPLPLCLGIAFLVLAGTVIILIDRSSATIRRRLGEIVVLALVLTQSAQLIGPSDGFPGGAPSTAEDESATDSSQLAAFDFIRTHSNPDQVIATNTHCLTGSLDGADCDPRRFILAAVTQRRVLVEGWGYVTQHGTAKEWVQHQLALSDDFIDAPSAAGAQRLEKLGVAFVYVDLRLNPSPDLGMYSDLVFDSEWARVYQLAP